MFLQHLIYFLKRPYHFIKTGLLSGLAAQIKYGFPARKLTIIAFTGTDGKTTSSTMMYSVLKAAGEKVALLSTVAAYVGDQAYDTGFHVTSPDPKDLQRFMRMMVDQGYKYLVLEATSHGIYQYRTWGVKPYIAGVTNIANEHLDYHLNYDNYVEAKAMLLSSAHTAVINADDQSYPKLKRLVRNHVKKLVEYSKEHSLPPVVGKAITARFEQPYNQMNARLVTTVAQLLGVRASAIAKGITEFPGVPGRMQSVPNSKGLNVIVDFAHTPQALEAALSSLRKKTNSPHKLIAVFGCAGLRDRSKRPVMGKIASEIADYAVFTAEDPRTEDIWAILRQMKEGMTEGHAKVTSIPDRRAAIEFALTKLAKKGDTIGIFGKGHEKSMSYGYTEYPWDDVQAVESILGK